MSIVQELPADWQPSPVENSVKLSPLKQRKLLPAGPSYLAHVRRAVLKRTLEEDEALESTSRSGAASRHGGINELDDDLGVGDESESDELLLLDPKDWKNQDHYAVLGLSHLRYKVSPEQVKIAHRKKVLKHHPDKKAGAVGETNDDAFFKCIQKATETLLHSEKKRQFDSVDPYYLTLEADIPSASSINKDDPSDFFEQFGPVFEREARFSKITPVPLLGGYDDSKASVEQFYDFWYNFDSWRSFEYQDKEVNEGSDSRDDKRYTEKKNRAERARKKKEDIARLRRIVDVALSADPRIKRIKQEEKESRDAKKRGKAGTPAGNNNKAEAEAKKKAEEEERKAKEVAEAAAKEDAKKAKAAAANAAKKARRAARAATETNGTAS